MGKGLDLDQTLVDGREIIAGGPAPRAVFAPVIDFAGLERLQQDGAVAVILGPQGAEVIAPLVDRNVPPPVIGDPLKLDETAGLKGADPIGAAAKRRFQGGFGEITALPVMLRQHRQLADNRRQFQTAGRRKAEGHLARANHFGLGHILVVIAVNRRALGGQRLKGPDHIGGRNRLAVMPTRLGAQFDPHARAIRRHLQAFDQAAVGAEILIAGRPQQGVIGQPDQGRRHPFHDERVEAVEGARGADSHLTALGRGWIDIIEMTEIGRVFERAIGREAVAPSVTVGAHGGGAEANEGDCGQCGDPPKVAPCAGGDDHHGLSSRLPTAQGGAAQSHFPGRKIGQEGGPIKASSGHRA